MSRANDGKLTTACIAALRRSYQPTGEVFHLRKAYATAESFARVGLYGDVPKINESLRCAMQREITRGLAARVKPGWYRYLTRVKSSTTQENAMLAKTPKSQPETAFQAAFNHAQAKARAAPDKIAKAEKNGFAESNVQSVVSMQSRKIEKFTLPTGGTVEIMWAQYRPSDFVANIASITNPGAGYQRRPQDRTAKLNAMARDFKPYLLAPFDAWINENGLPELLDALGRTFVCLHKLTPPYNEPIMTRVHLDVKNRKQAAARFLELNSPLTTKVNVKGIFLTRLAKGDGLALTVDAEARMGGLIVGSGGRDGISPQAAESLHRMGVLKEVGLLKTNGEWKTKLPNPYFVGLGGYLIATDDNSQILRELMRATSVQAVTKSLHEMYDASTPHARITAARFARTLLSLRNYRRTNNRVYADWSRVDTVMSEPPFSDRWGVLS